MQQRLAQLLETGANIEERGDEETPLQVAAGHEQAAVVSLLLEHRANVSATRALRWGDVAASSLHMAVTRRS